MSNESPRKLGAYILIRNKMHSCEKRIRKISLKIGVRQKEREESKGRACSQDGGRCTRGLDTEGGRTGAVLVRSMCMETVAKGIRISRGRGVQANLA